MKVFLQVLYTWLLTHILHPFIFIIYAIMLTGKFDGDIFFLEFVLNITFYTFLFSIPGLMIGWLLFHLITELRLSVFTKFILWILAVIVIIVSSCFLLLSSIINTSVFEEYFLLVIPIVISGIFAILIRHPWISNILKNTKTNNHEINLV